MKENERNKRFFEETLFQAGKWALLSLRIPGYLPLTRNSQTGEFTVKYFSFFFIYSIILSISAILVNFLCYYLIIITVFGNVKSISVGESTLGFSVAYILTYSTFLRFMSIAKSKKSINVWTKTVHLLQQLKAYGFFSEKDSKFMKIGKDGKRWTLTFILLGVTHVGFTFKDFYPVIFTETGFQAKFLIAFFMDFFMIFTLCFHVGYLIWITFLVQIIKFAFECMGEECGGEDIFESETTSLIVRIDLTPETPMISEETKSVTRRKVKEESDENRRRIIDMYGTLEDYVGDLNDFVGWTLVFEHVFVIVFMIVYTFVAMEAPIRDLTTTLSNVFIPIAIYALAMNNFTEDCTAMSNSALDVLKKLKNYIRGSEGREFHHIDLQIMAMLNRLRNCPIILSTAGFSTIGRSTIVSCLGIITTYLVILIGEDSGADPAAKTPMFPPPEISLCPVNTTRICQCTP